LGLWAGCRVETDSLQMALVARGSYTWTLWKQNKCGVAC
jgi:hypothetical protein